jgi:hypothetical protein
MTGKRQLVSRFEDYFLSPVLKMSDAELLDSLRRIWDDANAGFTSPGKLTGDCFIDVEVLSGTPGGSSRRWVFYMTTRDPRGNKFWIFFLKNSDVTIYRGISPRGQWIHYRDLIVYPKEQWSEPGILYQLTERGDDVTLSLSGIERTREAAQSLAVPIYTRARDRPFYDASTMQTSRVRSLTLVIPDRSFTLDEYTVKVQKMLSDMYTALDASMADIIDKTITRYRLPDVKHIRPTPDSCPAVLINETKQMIHQLSHNALTRIATAAIAKMGLSPCQDELKPLLTSWRDVVDVNFGS